MIRQYCVEISGGGDSYIYLINLTFSFVCRLWVLRKGRDDGEELKTSPDC